MNILSPMERKSPYFAAVDLGSNSFHLLIVKIHGDSLETVDRVKDMVQIAQGLQHNNTLLDAAQERALHCLRCFQERLHDIPADQIRVVATKAMRMASNAAAFLQKAEQALQHPIDIISGYEEARLVYLGTSHNISADKGQRLIIDIGGGSTEFIIGSGPKPLLMESLSIGCVTYTDRYFSDQQGNIMTESINATNLNEAYYATRIQLEPIGQIYRGQGWDIAVGSSGTVRAIAELIPNNQATGVINAGGLDQLKHSLQQTGTLSKTDGISTQRYKVLAAGIAILSAIFDELGLSQIHVVKTTLKEGLIYDTLGRLSARDIRDQTVGKLMEQYHVDKAQVQRVERCIKHFLPSLPTPHVINSINISKILHWAAKLHEIGLSISHSGHHHHSHYLLSNSDMAGFSRFEQKLLAVFVGSHRRKIRAERLNVLSAETQASLSMFLPCLRLAVLLNQRRDAQNTLPTFYTQDNIMRLQFPPHWLDKHPLTYRNLLQEQHYLQVLGIQLDFH
ncbi:MAG: Ppx/GppA family phosphatase [Cellvibrionaceae bacterium]|nr:Ppx/GppA family phosphatase [Cellvibrionaceae bacterium]